MELGRHRGIVESRHGRLESQRFQRPDFHSGGVKLLQRTGTDALRGHIRPGWMRLLYPMQQRQSSGRHVHT